MKSFTTVELLRSLPDVELAAARAPVAITKHRKPRYVFMSYDDYQELAAAKPDPRRVYRTEETPEDLREFLIEGLQEIANGRTDDG